MRSTIALVALLLVVAGLSGCTSSPTGPATSANQCAIAETAFAKIVKAPLSSPYKSAKFCYFGIGKNSTKRGDALSLLSGDMVQVAYSRSNVDSLYRAATQLPSQSLSGVGSEAVYWDRGDGQAQVFARTSSASCWVLTNFNSASEVGLQKPAGSRVIGKADVRRFASELGTVCNALFGR
jgi:hypothetical protein